MILNIGIKHKMNNSLVFAFDHAELSFFLKIKLNSAFNGVFSWADFLQLVVADAVFEFAGFTLIRNRSSNRIKHPLFEISVELVFESVSPMVLVSQ